MLTSAPLAVILAPLLLVIAALVAAPAFDLTRTRCRLLIALGVGAVTVSYLHWRLTVTIPWTAPDPALGFALFILAVELFAMFDAVILYAALVRRTDRSGEADVHEARLAAIPRDRWPAVDLIIATYNEPLDVL